MRVKSVSGLVFYVADLQKSVNFYKELGFSPAKSDADRAQLRVNWFTVDLVAADAEDKAEFQKDATAETKGTGLYIALSVEPIDEVYQELLDKGYQPSSQPRDWPWGNREFVLKDPDGYKLVFFEKLRTKKT